MIHCGLNQSFKKNAVGVANLSTACGLHLSCFPLSACHSLLDGAAGAVEIHQLCLFGFPGLYIQYSALFPLTLGCFEIIVFTV